MCYICIYICIYSYGWFAVPIYIYVFKGNCVICFIYLIYIYIIYITPSQWCKTEDVIYCRTIMFTIKVKHIYIHIKSCIIDTLIVVIGQFLYPDVSVQAFFYICNVVTDIKKWTSLRSANNASLFSPFFLQEPTIKQRNQLIQYIVWLISILNGLKMIVWKN